MDRKRYSTKISPHRSQGCFFNYQGDRCHTLKDLLHSAWIYLRMLKYQIRPEKIEWVQNDKPSIRSDELIITWLGHATCLIQGDGLNILTDPLFWSPSRFMSRIINFGLPLDQLPPIDIVLISHNHFDHLDERSVQYLQRFHKPLFLVPSGDAIWFKARGMHNVREFLWWQTHAQHDAFITFVPAFHWSQRTMFDQNRSLWGGWTIKIAGQTVYFAGDTGYKKNFFRAIGSNHIVDVALMPIGPEEPRLLMSQSHVDVKQGVQASIDVGARHMVPIHWGTFYFGFDRALDPYDRLIRHWATHARDRIRICPLKIGQRWEVPIQKKVQPITRDLPKSALYKN